MANGHTTWPFGPTGEYGDWVYPWNQPRSGSPLFPGTPDLSSRQTTPTMGMLPTGAGTGTAGGGVNWGSLPWGRIIGAGAGLAASAFAPNVTDPTGAIKETQQMARGLSQTGQQLGAQGAGALAPTLAYWMNLLSGNPADLLAATQPERTRILDQYDTARATLTRETPRGGGLATAMGAMETKKASDLANLTSQVRPQAAQALGTLGGQLTGAGLQAQEQAAYAMAQVLGPLLSQETQDKESIWRTFGGIAEMIAPFVLAAL
jgi:hypothetical protein